MICLLAFIASLAVLTSAQDPTTEAPKTTFEPGKEAAGAASGLVDNVMNNFFGAAFPWPNPSRNGFGRGDRQLAFMPAGLPIPSPRPTQPPVAGARPQQQQPEFMQRNFNIPIVQDLSSFFSNFGGQAMFGQPQAGTTLKPADPSFFGNFGGQGMFGQPQAGTTVKPAGPSAAPANLPVVNNWGNFFPSSNILPSGMNQIPNFGFGGQPLSMKCYMGSSISQYNQQSTQPCTLPQESRFYFDMLKSKCVGVSVCPRYTQTGWSTQQDGQTTGFASEDECKNTCLPTTTVAPVTTPGTGSTPPPVFDYNEQLNNQFVNMLPPVPAQLPIQNAVNVEPAAPVILDTVTLPTADSPTQTPFQLQ